MPTGFTSEINLGRQVTSNFDLQLSNDNGLHLMGISSIAPRFAKGPLTPKVFDTVKALNHLGIPADQRVPGVVKATVAGRAATGFDIDGSATGEEPKVRIVVFEHNGTIYQGMLITAPGAFAASLPLFNQVLASVKFAK